MSALLAFAFYPEDDHPQAMKGLSMKTKSEKRTVRTAGFEALTDKDLCTVSGGAVRKSGGSNASGTTFLTFTFSTVFITAV